jgi:uncharacterized protein DUF4129
VVRSRATVVAASAAGVAVLTGLVALGSRRSAPWGAPAVDVPSAGGGGLALGALAALALAAGIVWLALSLRRVPSRRRQVERQNRSWLAAVLGLLLVALILGSVGLQAQQRSRLVIAPAVPPRSHRPPAHPAHGSSVDPWLVAGIGAALAAALVAAALVGRTRRSVAEAEPEAVEPSAPTEPEAPVHLDALLADPDSRRAVIAAYAGMEQTMAVAGAGRRAPEAPLEYLSRLRATRAAVAPMADRLTALYQRARFGRAPISPAMRDDAVAALRALREAEAS